MASDLDKTVEEIWAAHQQGDHYPQAFADALNRDEAYRVQLAIIEKRIALGEQQIGWKVGLTAKAIQEQFGIHEPVFGCLMRSFETGHVYEPSEMIKPGFETELCVKLARDILKPLTMEEARQAVAALYPAFEIIETRGEITQTSLTIADNSQQHSIVLGEPIPLADDLVLEDVEAKVWINGELVTSGFGSAVLDNPLNSVVFLSEKLGQYDRQLKAGDFIMCGSFVKQFPLSPGDKIAAEFSGVGRVEAGLS